MGRHHPQLDFADDVTRQVDLDRVKAELFQGPFNSNALGFNREALFSECFSDLVGTHGTVQVPLGIRIGLDRERALRDLCGQVLEIGPSCFLKLFQAAGDACRPFAGYSQWRRSRSLEEPGNYEQSRDEP